MSDSEDPIDPIAESGDDLFGDEPDDVEEGLESPKARVLDDDDLASDPEGDTYARYRDEDQTQDQDEVRERIVIDVTTYRHPVPRPSDGQVSSGSFMLSLFPLFALCMLISFTSYELFGFPSLSDFTQKSTRKRASNPRNSMSPMPSTKTPST